MAGFFTLLILAAAFAVPIVLCARKASLLPALIAGVIFRMLLLGLEHFDVFSAPGANSDAADFANAALLYSTYSWNDLLAQLDYRSARSYSVLGAAIYKLVGVHQYLLPAVNIFIGSIVITVTALITYREFGGTSARTAAFIVALYPFSAFNSVVVMREELGIVWFVVGLWVLLGWVRSARVSSFLGACVCFVIASVVHPGFIAALLGSCLFFFFRSVADLKGGVGQINRALPQLLLSLALMLGGGAALLQGVELGKGMEFSPDIDQMSELLGDRFVNESRGGSAYPAIVTTGNPFAQPWLIPARMIYFLYSPFVWDVRSAVHITGLLVGLFYIWLSIRAWRAWRSRAMEGRIRVLGWVFMSLTFVFAMGVTNSGTAIRHKTKFFPLLVILAAPTFRKRIVIGSTPKAASVQIGSGRLGVDR